MARPLPILHVVYAGRGDSLYVEFDRGNDIDSPLFVMDGGPRGHGVYGQAKKKKASQPIASKPYWRFFFSAGKEIWYEQIGKPVTEPFKLHAMVNSHMHEDHYEGMFDMITNLSTDFLKLETGFITPAFDDNQKCHIVKLWNRLCRDGPRLCFPLRHDSEPMTTWDRREFVSGSIEYPPYARAELDRPTLLCLRRPTDIAIITDRPPSPIDDDTGLENFMDLIKPIKPYVESLDKAITTGKTLDDLNLSSLLIHVPVQANTVNGGIYLTGDNNANLINAFMQQPPARRHFGIYKLQHHGGHLDSQLLVAEESKAKKIDERIIGEVAFFMTLLAQGYGRKNAAVSDGDCHRLLGKSGRSIANKGRAGLGHLVENLANKLDARKMNTDDILGDLMKTLHIRYQEYQKLIEHNKGSAIAYQGRVYHSRNMFTVILDPWEEWQEFLRTVEALGRNSRLRSKTEREYFWVPPWKNKPERATRKPLSQAEAFKLQLDKLRDPKPEKKLKKEGSDSVLENNHNRVREELEDEFELEIEIEVDTESEVASGNYLNDTMSNAKKFNMIMSQAKITQQAARELRGTPRPWWTMWWRRDKDGRGDGLWFKRFDLYARLQSIRGFFDSFTADAYVASANRQDDKHPHPHEDTIAGLAISLREQGRCATLYITNPWSFDEEKLGQSLQRAGLTPADVINKYLFVRYPRIKQVMSLTANPALPTGVERHLDPVRGVFRNAQGDYVQALHDLNNCTAPLLLESDPGYQMFSNWAMKRNEKMESLNFWTAMAATQSSMATMYHITPTSIVKESKNCYLNLNVHGYPTVERLPQGTTCTLKVQEGWEGDEVEDHNTLLLSRLPTSAERRQITVHRRRSGQSNQFHIRWLQRVTPMDAEESVVSFYPGPAGIPEVRQYEADDTTSILFTFTAIKPEDVILNSTVHNMAAQNLLPLANTFGSMVVANTAPVSMMMMTMYNPFIEPDTLTAVEVAADSEPSCEDEPSAEDVSIVEDTLASEDELSTGEDAAIKIESAEDPGAHVETNFLTPEVAAVISDTAELLNDEDQIVAKTNESKKVGGFIDGDLEFQSEHDAVVTVPGDNTLVAKHGSFAAFFAAARLQDSDVKTGGLALTSMFTNSSTLEDLGMTGAHEVQLLGYGVDYEDIDKTWISFTDDGINVAANRAVMQLIVPKDAKISLTGPGSAPADVIDAKMLLEAGVDGTLSVALVATTRQISPPNRRRGRLEAYSELRVVKTLCDVGGPSLLAKALSGMGISDSQIGQLTVLETLAIVLAGDEHAIKTFFDGLPLALVMLEGFTELRPNWRTSTAKAEYSATRQVIINQTSIVFDLEGHTKLEAPDRPSNSFLFSDKLLLGGFSVKLKSVRIDILNPRLANECILLHATTGFSAPGGSEVDLQMAVSPIRNGDGTIDAYFFVSKAESLSDLSDLLGQPAALGTSISNLTVPFSRTGSNKDVALDKVPLTAGSFGFVLQQQPVQFAADEVRLLRVFASADLTGWLHILPAGFPAGDAIKNVHANVDVLNPFDDEQRRLRVEVAFDLDLAVQISRSDGQQQTSMRRVGAMLSAIPLVYPGDFEYRIDVRAEATGMSLSEITQTIGLRRVIGAVSDEVPFLKSALEGVYVRDISIGLVDENDKWRVGDWSIEVWLPRLQIVTGVVVTDVDITLRDFGSVEVIASAVILLGSPPVVIYVEIRSPTRCTGGELLLNMPDGVSVQKVLDAFKLRKYNDVPLVGQILDTELTHMSLTTTPTKDEKPAAIDGFKIRLYHPSINIGPLKLIDVTFDFRMFCLPSSDKAGGRGQIISHKELHIGAYILGGDLLVTVQYKSDPDWLRASLEPLQTVNIGRILQACLPDSFPGLSMLKPIVDDLQFKKSTIEFFTSGGLGVRHFDFHVADDTVVLVQRLALQEVKVVYDVAAAEDDVSDTELHEDGPDTESGAFALVGGTEETQAGQTDKFVKTLDILAIIKKGPTHVKITIHSITNAEADKTVAFSIEPAVENGLTIRSILSLFNWTDADVDFSPPERIHPRPFDVSVDIVKGELTREASDKSSVDGSSAIISDENSEDKAMRQGSGDDKAQSVPKTRKSLSVKTFQVTAHMKDPIPLENTDIAILELKANLTYDAEIATPAASPNASAVSGLNATLYGKLRIGKLLLELTYIHKLTDSGDKEHSFYAQADITELLKKEYNAPARLESKSGAPGGLDLAVLATASSIDARDITLPPRSTHIADGVAVKMMPTLTMVSPNTLGARVRLTPVNCVEIWAAGNEVWSGNVCGVTIDLQKLVAFFRYTQGKFKSGQKRQPSVYEAYLRGRVEIKGYVAAEAQLSISKEENNTFTALLERAPGMGTESLEIFGFVADDVGAANDTTFEGPSSSAGRDAAWKNLVPDFKEPMPFDKTSKLFMFADFKSKKILLAATVQHFGAALLLGLDPNAELRDPVGSKTGAESSGNSDASGHETTVHGETSKPTSVNGSQVSTLTKKPSRRKYIFFLEVEDLNRLWVETQDDIGAQFNISQVVVQVIGYQTTLKQLREDIAIMTTRPAQEGSDASESNFSADSRNPSVVDPLYMTPATMAMELFRGMDEGMVFRPGAWIVAELNLESRNTDNKPMIKVLTLDASNLTGETRPTVRIYAKIVKERATDPANSHREARDQQSETATSHESLPQEEHTEYGIYIRNLRIFQDSVTIDGSGKYLPQGKELAVDARLRLQLSESPSDELVFGVKLSMTNTRTSFEMAAKIDSTQILISPFNGGMFNVRFESLRIKGSSTRNERTHGVVERKCTVQGTALLGGGINRDDKLLGLIHFENGKPVVAVVDFTRRVLEETTSSQNALTDDTSANEGELVPSERREVSLRMTEIYSGILQPGAAAGDSHAVYPSECDDFELLDAYMSYNKTDTSIMVGSRTCESGFNIYGSFLVFRQPIAVSLRIKSKRQGFQLRGTYGRTLDLGILQLTGFDSKTYHRKGDGLTVSLETTDGALTYGIESGLKLFEFDQVYFRLQYRSNKSKAERKLEGLAIYEGTFLGVKDPQMTVVHQNGKWSFSGWKIKRKAYWESPGKLSPASLQNKPLSPDDNLESLDGLLVNIDKAVELGSKADSKKGCGDLVNFVIDQLVDMQFDFDLSMLPTDQSTMEASKQAVSSKHDQNEGFRFKVKWYFTMSIKNPFTGSDTSIAVRMELQEFTFVLPLSGFKPTFSGLLAYLWNAVLSQANLTELGTKLLDPVVLGKITGVMVLEKLSKKLIENMVCREPEKAENLKEESKKRNQQQRKKKIKEAERQKKKMDDTRQKAEHEEEVKSNGNGDEGGKVSGKSISGTAVEGGGGVLGVGVGIGIGIGVGIGIIGLGSGVGGRDGNTSATGDDTDTHNPDPDPTLSPEYGTYSLLDLIELYVAAVKGIERVKPEDLKSGRLATVLVKWKWANLGDDVEDNYQQLMAKLAEVHKSREATKATIQKRMNLRDTEADRTANEGSTPGISAKFTEDDEDLWIDIDISHALPLRKWVHPDDYKELVWHVYVGTDANSGPPADDDVEKFKTMLKVCGTAHTLRCDSADFRYRKAAHIWVRMFAEVDNFGFAASKWASTTATHTPWLRPPAGVQLRLEDTSSGRSDGSGFQTTLVVEMPPVNESTCDWDVAFITLGSDSRAISAGKKKATFFFSSCYSAVDAKGPAQFRIDTSQLGYNTIWPPSGSGTADPSGIVARVRQLPWDPAIYHSSLPKDSFQTLAVLPPPPALKADMSRGNIVVSWTASGTTQQLAVQLLRKETQQVVNFEIRESSSPVPGDVSRHAMILVAEKLIEGEVLSVLARASLPASTGMLCLLAEASLKVAYPLELAVSEGSNWDAASEILTMVVLANKNIPEATSTTPILWQLDVVPADATKIDPEYAAIIPRSVQGKQAILRKKVPAASLARRGGGTKIFIRAGLPGGSDVTDTQWSLPPLSEVAVSDIGEPWCTFEAGDREKKLILGWAAVQGVDITITVLCETMAFKQQSQTINGAEGRCVFAFQDGSGSANADSGMLTRLPPSGTKLVCWLVVNKDKALVVGRRRVEIVVPS
ncbi:hypothetical protein CSIM01_09977 [Colletotrichum simmondsii]|uniref:Uncharacterized protein n=1 Tax=Colletotrichum simmondsii TaxID=703756 RepID=A0A135RMF2_9PEZI|nr:hypothetical protein CSIM01_09977 [Colletotrichum simmondsii]